jgi:hypothetical protein
MTSSIVFDFKGKPIYYVGDGVTHRWNARDVFDAINLPPDEASRFLEFRETVDFADCLGFASVYPNIEFAKTLKDFVIDVSGAELWRALYARQYSMFTSEYFLWSNRYYEELNQQDVFSQNYRSGALSVGDNAELLSPEKWPKIKCFPDFLFMDKEGVFPGEMKRAVFTGRHLVQLQRYMRTIGTDRGVAIAEKLHDSLSLPNNIKFVSHKPVPYEEYMRLESLA